MYFIHYRICNYLFLITSAIVGKTLEFFQPDKNDLFFIVREFQTGERCQLWTRFNFTFITFWQLGTLSVECCKFQNQKWDFPPHLFRKFLYFMIEMQITFCIIWIFRFTRSQIIWVCNTENQADNLTENGFLEFLPLELSWIPSILIKQFIDSSIYKLF